jgi:hypothetical protein
LEGEDRAYQLGNSWTGQVAATGDVAPAILGAYWRCRSTFSRACRLPSALVDDALVQRADTDLLAGLHYDYTLPKGVERHATGNYGILDDDPGAQGRSTTAHPL